MVHLDAYALSIQDFVGERVAIASIIMSLVLLGSGVVLPSLPLAVVLAVLLPTLLGLGVGLSGPR